MNYTLDQIRLNQTFESDLFPGGRYKVTAIGKKGFCLFNEELQDELYMFDFEFFNGHWRVAPPLAQHVIVFPGGTWTWRTKQEDAERLAEETGGTYLGLCIPSKAAELQLVNQ